MTDSIFRIRLIILGLLIVTSLLLLGLPFIGGGQGALLPNYAKEGNYLRVAFLDVGQGDSIFIETPEGVQLLIDGGPDGSVLRELPKQMSFFDRTIDVVLATHSDKDHIGGLVDVLKRYQVEQLLMTENKNDTAVTEAFTTAVGEEETNIQLARAGQQYQLGASTTLLILSPTSDPTDWESNSASIIVQLQYGDMEFMLTGDAPLGIEEYLVEIYGNLLESEVLKLGHHGSRTSTADSFLDKVRPEYAIVSAGKDNRYGHPHLEVLNKLVSRGIKVLSTASEGTVVFKSDGKNVWVE